MGHEMKFKCSNLQITETYTPALGVLQILAPHSTALHDDHKVKQTMPREIASTGKLLGDFVPGVFTGAGHEGTLCLACRKLQTHGRKAGVSRKHSVHASGLSAMSHSSAWELWELSRDRSSQLPARADHTAGLPKDGCLRPAVLASFPKARKYISTWALELIPISLKWTFD